MSTRSYVLGLGAALSVLVGPGTGLARASGLDECKASCNRANLSATNRASCRLDCEADAASDPELIRARMAPLVQRTSQPATAPRASGATSSKPGKAAACKAECEADGALSADDRATCKLECDLEPAPMPTGTPPPMRPPAAAASSATSTTLSGPVGVLPRAPVAAPVDTSGFLDRCHATCEPGSGAREATDFETCKLDCATMASVIGVAGYFVPDAFLTTPRPIATRVEPPVRVASHTPTATPRRAGPVASGGDTCGPALQQCRADCVKTEASCARKCGRKHVQETDRETCKLGCGTDQEVCQGDCLTATATCVNTRLPR